MKGLIQLEKLNKNNKNSNYSLNYDLTFDYSFEMYIDEEDSFQKILDEIDSKVLLERLKGFIHFFDNNNEEYEKYFKKYEGREKQLLSDAEYVAFDFDIEKVKKYIEKNPILKSKKIVFLDSKITYQSILELEKTFGNDTSLLYFKPSGNTEIISFNECKNTLKIINDIVEKVKRANFSQIEQIMYVYDIVKGRIYCEEGSEEDKSISRDLSKVLIQDKIVCTGYSVLLEKILEQLNIKVKSYYLQNKRDMKGHQRNIVYLKDSKYKIEGVYYLDATWDSKKSTTDGNYLNYYYHFLKTKYEIENNNYDDLVFGTFNSDFIDEFDRIVRENGLNAYDEKKIEQINELSFFIDGSSLIKKYMYEEELKDFYINVLGNKPLDFDYTLDTLKRYYSMLNKPISGEVYTKALLSVRKVQYYENPNNIEFNLKEIYTAACLSSWKFSSTKTEKALTAIFDEKVEFENKKRVKTYLAENKVQEEIEKVKVARVLRKVLNNKCKM